MPIQCIYRLTTNSQDEKSSIRKLKHGGNM